MAAKQGRILYREIIQLTYYKLHAYDDILVEGPGNIRLHGWSTGPSCSAEGRVTARVMCDTRGCISTDTGHSIPIKVARQWLQLDPAPQRMCRYKEQSLKDTPEPIKKEYQVPPVVHLARDTVFPQGDNIEYWLDNSTSSNTSKEAEELIQCRNETITNQGVADSRRQEKICNTTEEAKIQCEQVVSGGSRNSSIVSHNYTSAAWVWIGDLSNGTELLADIFWVCEGDRQVIAVLPANWTGICAVMVTGLITIISPTNGTSGRARRSTETQTRSWEKDANIYITWDQVPVGVPDDHNAISEAWIDAEPRGPAWVPVPAGVAKHAIPATSTIPRVDPPNGQPTLISLYFQQRRPDGRPWTLHPDDVIDALRSAPAIDSATDPDPQPPAPLYTARASEPGRNPPPRRGLPRNTQPSNTNLSDRAQAGPSQERNLGEVNLGLKYSQCLVQAAKEVQTTTTAQAPPQKKNPKDSARSKLLPLRSPDPSSSSEDDVEPLSSYSPTTPPPRAPLPETDPEPQSEGHLKVKVLSHETRILLERQYEVCPELVEDLLWCLPDEHQINNGI
ncbi:hypothetical protein ABVT39_022505 [Epinephelus coioides]